MQVDVDTKTGKEKISRYRTGKAAWFPDYLDKTVAKVSKRIQAMTGLDLDLSEDYQVFNYGIGGQYLPHLDVDEVYSYINLWIFNNILFSPIGTRVNKTFSYSFTLCNYIIIL